MTSDSWNPLRVLTSHEGPLGDSDDDLTTSSAFPCAMDVGAEVDVVPCAIPVGRPATGARGVLDLLAQPANTAAARAAATTTARSSFG